MLTKISDWVQGMPKIKKYTDGKDVSCRGSFAYGEGLEFVAEVPRELGASAVVLRINKDGQNDMDFPFSFVSTDFVNDEYRLTLDTAKLCGEDGDGLFFYEVLFLRGRDTLFTATDNNVDFKLASHSDARFSLLIYQKDFETPQWFHGSTMYQIFVDRFCKGEGKVGKRDDVIINSDWNNGVPQYTENAGEELKNNMFFGGNLWGVSEKLDYLKSLGVDVVYLNPIFKAYSNHKYDTGDYLEIDSMFGGKEAFDDLLKKSKERGIRIILDGVFNHTGDRSLYFDRYGEYGENGAYLNGNSPYRDWYKFGKSKDDYESWWGIKILPRLNHENDGCRAFFTGKDGVGAHYIKEGISGWRLDVADELSDKFLDEFTESVKKESNGEAVIIGEVWENAATKEAYGRRRKYLRGGQLDSVMNYPLRNGILEFVITRDAGFIADVLKSVYSSYPKTVCDSLMNILGTHDTERALTVLGKMSTDVTLEKGSVLATKRLGVKERNGAIKRMKLASAIQYTVYGVPSVYYGDEAGLEGYRDPFCRMPFPWGREEESLVRHFAKLGKIRKDNKDVLADGEFCVEYAQGGLLVYSRTSPNGEIRVIANSERTAAQYSLSGKWKNLMNGKIYDGKVGGVSFAILRKL